MNPIQNNHSQRENPAEKIKTGKIVNPAFVIESDQE